MEHILPSGVESAPNAPTLGSIEAAERKLQEKEQGQLHSNTSPNPVMYDIPDYVNLHRRPMDSPEKERKFAEAADKGSPKDSRSQSRGPTQEKDPRSESRMSRGENQSAPVGLNFGEEMVHEQADGQGNTPSRPQPTPIQAGGISYSEPAYGWDVLPEGTTSTMAQAMIRKASENNYLEASSLFAPDGIGEGSTLDELRRAARRASFDRQVAKLPFKNPEAKLPPHSLSFPLDASKAFGKPMTGPGGVLSITEAKLGSSTTSAGSYMGATSPETVQPARQEPPSFLRSVEGQALQKESALRGHMAGEQGPRDEDWRMNEPEEVRTDPSVKVGSPKTSNRQRRSSANDSKSTSMASNANLGESTPPVNNHVYAGRQAEKFYGEHGYLPAVYPPNELDRRKALRRYGPPVLVGNANFDRIAHLVKLVFNTKLVLISFVGEREQIFRSEAGAAQSTLEQMDKSRDCSFCGHAILQEGDEPIVVLDATKDWRFAGNPLVLGLPSIRFYAGSPLRTADGFNIGSLCIIDDRPREEFNPRQRHTLREFARIVMREMELLRDRMHFNARDRMQHSIENFTRECLEMDMEDSTDGQVQDAQGARRIYGLAAENMREALQANGAVVFDLSHFELIESFPPDSEDSSTKIFFPSPYSQPDLKPFASAERPDQVDVVDSPFWDRSNKDIALKSKLVPPMVVLGASEESDPPRQRADPVPLSHHVQVAQFLRAHPAGRFYPYTPTPLRHLLPEGISRLLVVPIFGLNRQPFALLCSYSTSSEEGGTLEELKDTGLQYLRAVGMIILSAVLRKDIMLADKAKSHFISNISHELRTPLHGILAAAELLTETRLSATQGSYLDTVEACGKSLLELVNHVLDFTKLSGSSRSKGVQLHSKTKCDLVRLVQEVCESSWIGQMAKSLEMQSNSGIGSFYAPPPDEVKSTAAAVPQKLTNSEVETIIEVSFREEGWLVNCDTGGIRRVLMNLIGNSLKFTTAGFVHISLRELSSTDSHVIVELGVTDTGRGISRHFLEEQLFHPFTQENTLGTGTGLGLSIVNSIVQSPAMNGKIDVWSTEGQGTEIKVTCELEKAEPGELEGTIYRSNLNVAGESSVMLLGFGETRGQQDLKEVLLGYLCGWWKFALAEENVSKPGDLILVNEELDLIQSLITLAPRPLPPVIVLTSSRGGQDIASACDKYHEAGGVARILFKPAGPAKIEAVVDFCLQCIERVRAGKPPLDVETKADTPLPSPAAPVLSVEEEENQDYFTLEAREKDPVETDETPRSLTDLTPRGAISGSSAHGSGTHGRSDSKHDGFYMSPPAPTANAAAALIRRHSAEDKSRSGKVLDQEAEGKRPLLPARSITYHEPRLHKHVLLSPMGRDRHGEEHGDYFAHSHGGSPSSPSSTPGSTVSLDGGEGAILKNVVHSTRGGVGAGTGGSRKRMQILSVEDNPINRKVIAAFLDKINVDFVEAVNGEEGVKLFEAHPPNHFDVILMDLSMPVLDGIGATAAIRRVEAERYTASLAANTVANSASTSASSATSLRLRGGLKHPSHRNRVKIFALTGRSSDEDKRMAFATGADGYIVKPLSFKVLSSLLKMLSR